MATHEILEVHEVIAGPGTMDLALALIEGDTKYRKPVTFSLKLDDSERGMRSPQIRVAIYSLERKYEGISSHEWIFKGHEISQSGERCNVIGEYSTSSNTGILKHIIGN
jgi:hypothetical protein